jgi:hypothetical protein
MTWEIERLNLLTVVVDAITERRGQSFISLSKAAAGERELIELKHCEINKAGTLFNDFGKLSRNLRRR